MIDMTSLGRWILMFGLFIAVIGGLLWFVGRTGIPLGRLPGDFRFQTGGVTCFFPLATTIILSVLLTLAINILARWLSK